MAPETALRRVKPNFATDVWCAGATILQILVQKDLWTVPDDADLMDFLLASMTKKAEPDALTYLKGVDATSYQKVKQAMAYDPEERATAKQLYELFK